MLKGKESYEKYINQFLLLQYPNNTKCDKMKGPVPQWVIDALTYAGFTIYDRI